MDTLGKSIFAKKKQMIKKFDLKVQSKESDFSSTTKAIIEKEEESKEVEDESEKSVKI